MELFEKFYDNLSKRPNRILYSDTERDYSSLDIEKISGKVYCYLCAHNIGKEDIVLIHLKRSAKIAFVFYGILKAGACAVIVDGDANKEYFDYFYNDSCPKLVIDENTYNDILNYDYQKGNKEPNEHDAAFIVYTSSSTAKPKGCIHEYGDIDLHLSCIKSPDMMAYVFKERIAFVAEFYDIASITTLFDVIYGESYLYVIQRDFVRNKEKLFKIIKENNLTTSILMPRFIDENLLSTLQA